MKRRDFLKYLAYSGASVPLLPSIVSANQKVMTPLNKIVFIISPFGQFPENWIPQIDTVQAEKNVYLRKFKDHKGDISKIINRPFEGFKKDINIISGLDLLTSTNHSRCVPMTAANHSKHMNYDSKPLFPESIDVIIGRSKSFYKTKPRVRNLILSPSIRPLNNSYSWRKNENDSERIPAMWNIESIKKNLFAENLASTDQHLNHESVAELNAFVKNPALSQFDRDRLSEFIEEYNFILMPNSRDHCLYENHDSNIQTYSSSFAIRRSMDMAVRALQCGLTQLVSISISDFCDDANKPYEWWHANSHMTTPEAASISLQGNRWIASHVAHLIGKLDQIKEQDGSRMLDNTLVVWTNEISSGSYHDSYNMPILTAGSLQGAFSTGQYIDYVQRPARRYVNTSDSFCIGRPYNFLMNSILDALNIDPAEYETEKGRGFGHYDDKHIQSGLWDDYLDSKRSRLPLFAVRKTQ